MPGPRKKYESLLKDTDIKRWYNELTRSSVITADTYLRRLGSFCNSTNKSPQELVSMDEKKITDLISDEISSMERQKLAGSYIASTVKAVKSWLNYNGKKLSRKIKIKDQNANFTLRNERIPTQEELKKILASGDPRARVACVLMAHSGLRPESLGNYLGDDGLRISDFPEMEIKDGKVTFKNIPTIVIIRPELSKSKRQYFTFLGNEGCFYLKAYLEERINQKEKDKDGNVRTEEITHNSPIIAPSKLYFRKEDSFIRTINIGDIIREAIRKAGFTWRPYVLRAYFDTQLMMAESKGLILRDYRSFMMGHVGDIENRYTTNKHKLPENLIEDMRESYAKSLVFLETEKRGMSEEEKDKWKTDLKREYLRLFFDDKEIDDNKLLDLSTEDLQKKVKEKIGMSLNNGHSQKVISMKEVKQYIEQGWEFVQSINSREAIVRIPK
ncbi:MAG: site-specific integrase [Candidatus Parvarchaeota archaeon]